MFVKYVYGYEDVVDVIEVESVEFSLDGKVFLNGIKGDRHELKISQLINIKQG